jgi:hypothetical protein
MALDLKELEKLGLEDLIDLRDNKVPESKVLDYKIALKFGDKDKREFLADVSSFANTAGGHLLIGVKEEGGFPTDFPGVELNDPDAEKLKLINIIRDSVEPRIPGVTIHNIPVSDSNYVTVIRIPKSWVAPHVVTFDKHWRFYGRHSSGKYPLDVPELKAAFLLSESISDKIKSFRTERLIKIIANETPVKMPDAPKVVLQLVPFSAFSTHANHELYVPSINEYAEIEPIKPAYPQGMTHCFNFDGFLRYSPAGATGDSIVYSQLFRDGIIETVDSSLIQDKNRPLHNQNLLYIRNIENSVVEALSRYIKFLSRIQVEPPFAVLLSLLGVIGMCTPPSSFGFDSGNPIDRDHLLLPEILIDDLSRDVDVILRPIFDSIWNAAGHECSPSYDGNGRLKKQ